jgi:carboxypeptidase family protein
VRIASLVCVLSSLTTSSGPAEQQRAIPLASATGQGVVRPLAGMVTDTSGIALGHARISILDTRYETRTDSGGRYAFDTLSPGRYTVRAQLLGFMAGRRDSVVVAGGATTTVNFKLRPTACDLDCKPVVVPAPARNPPR